MSDKNTTIENYLYHINKIKEESVDSQITEHACGLLECATKVYSGESDVLDLVKFPNIHLNENDYQDARALNYMKYQLIELLAVGVEVVYV